MQLSSMVSMCLLLMVGALALAHQGDRILGELTDLGRQRAVEAVFHKSLGWGGEGTTHE